MATSYDYIIIGSGAAGLSLVIHWMEHPFFQDKEILLLDREQKTTNDRTWCFWQKGKSPLDDILTKKWEVLQFLTPESDLTLDIAPYAYKMIRSRDFYQKAQAVIQQSPNVEFRQDQMLEIRGKEVICEGETYHAKAYIFNSVPGTIAGEAYDHTLFQHFKGWFLKGDPAIISKMDPILMDFRIEQTYGCDFFYVLPFAEDQVLVEFTSFSPEILTDEVYEAKVAAYVEESVPLKEFSIEEKEFGIIPMTTAHIPRRRSESVINIGIAGGNAKPSTGYTFAFIQKNSHQITENILQGKDPLDQLDASLSRFMVMDAVFLRVLKEQKVPAWKIFDDFFQKLPADLILSFLNEDTSVWEDFRIRNSMPTFLFMVAAFKEFVPILKRWRRQANGFTPPTQSSLHPPKGELADSPVGR
ncbi:MAG: lycopene cyclase family protein [Bacteroidota bacterium]